MIAETLEYPLRGDDTLKTFLIGSILLLFSFIPIIPTVLLLGYFVRVLRGESDQPPTFDEWVTLGKEGVGGFVIVIVYSLIPFLILVFPLLIIGMFVGYGIVINYDVHSLENLLEITTVSIIAFFYFIALTIMGLLATLITSYVTPAALGIYARTTSLSATFTLKNLRQAIFSKSYLSAWLLAMAILVIGGLFATALMVILIGFVVLFYLLVVAFRILAQGLPAIQTSANHD